MNFQVLLIFQLIADIVLCVAIAFILYLVTKENKKNAFQRIDPAILSEFQKVLNASHIASTNLIKTMDDSRRALKEIAFALDERENRLKSLLKETEIAVQPLDSNAPPGNRYERVLAMLRQGMDADEIARLSGLTRGEIDLIIALDSKKNEPA